MNHGVFKKEIIMNKVNVQKAIDIMKRAGKIDMRVWQEKNLDGKYVKTEEELNSCGTAACFAGWISVSEEWKSDGGFTGKQGAPCIITENDGEIHNSMAIAYWLDITLDNSNKLLYGLKNFYKMPIECVRKEDIIDRLEKMLKEDTYHNEYEYGGKSE